MFRRYVNTKSNHILIVDENYIEKSTRIIHMLKVPGEARTILDKRIEFIFDERINLKDMDGYVFIDVENLTKELKCLYKDYYGSFEVYLYDFHLEESNQYRETTINKLNEELEKCLKVAVKPKMFLVKEVYQGIVLYDPEIPSYKNRWELVEEIKIA